MTLEHEELTSKVIAAAIEVHRRPGPGFIDLNFAKPPLVVKRLICQKAKSFPGLLVS